MKKIVLFLTFFFTIHYAFTQIQSTIKVTDSLTGKVLIGATISIRQNVLAITDKDGYGILNIPKNVIVKVSYLGYKTKYVSISPGEFKSISLVPSTVHLDDILITAEKNNDFVKNSSIGKLHIRGNQIQTRPFVFGEADIFKYLQMQPGVSFANEGSSTMIVRGSNGSENLILLDGAPVFNISHMSGFFSAIPAWAIKDVEFYKSYIPAEFSGRSASVTDITLLDGNKSQTQFNLDISTVSANLNVSFPLVKNKISAFVNVRRTYPDIIILPFVKAELSKIAIHFYDVIGKLNFQINPKTKLYVSFYQGRDVFMTKYKTTFDQNETEVHSIGEITQNMGLLWGNRLISARLNKMFTNNLLTTVLLYTSSYDLLYNYQFFKQGQNIYQNDWLYFYSKYKLLFGNQINETAIKVNNHYLLNNFLNLRFGGKIGLQTLMPERYDYQSLYKTLSPEDTVITSDSVVKLSEDKQVIFNLYLENKFELKKIKLNLGVSLNAYDNMKYVFLEPRLAMTYIISNNLSWKSGIFRTSQNMHVLTPSFVDLPVDYWVFSNDTIRPINLWSFSTGLYYAKGKFKFSVEGFYKATKNLVKLLPGEEIWDLYKPWYKKIDIGEGRAYGIEFLMQYVSQKFKINANYNYSISLRQFNLINFGQPFHYKYDRTHYLFINGTFMIKQNFSLGINWILTGGNRISVPEQIIYYQTDLSSYTYGYQPCYCLLGDHKPYYSSINNYQLPFYHRLDVDITYRHKGYKHLWTYSFGLYNAYNHMNIFSTILGADGRFYAVYLFPIFPYFKISVEL